MENCIHCDDTLATHEFNSVPARYEDDWTEEWEPVCEGCADTYPSNVTRPITHYECSLCGREMEREHPEPPICEWCEGTAKAAGKSMNDANRYPNPPRF